MSRLRKPNDRPNSFDRWIDDIESDPWPTGEPPKQALWPWAVVLVIIIIMGVLL